MLARMRFQEVLAPQVTLAATATRELEVVQVLRVEVEETELLERMEMDELLAAQAIQEWPEIKVPMEMQLLRRWRVGRLRLQRTEIQATMEPDLL